MVPADALVSLSLAADAEATRDFGSRIGTELGRRLAERLVNTPDPTIETVGELLAGEVSLLGFGLLGFERWGHALVLTVRGSPFGGPGDTLLASVLEGALQRAFGRDVGVFRLMREDNVARFLVTSRATVELVRVWVSSGASWPEALARLQPQSGGAS